MLSKRGAEKRIAKAASRLEDYENANDALVVIPPFRAWAKENLWIRKRGHSLEPWKNWTYGQEELGEYVEHKRARQQPIKVPVLKERQLSGSSTFWQAFIFYLTYWIPDRAALTAAHTDDAAVNLHGYINTFWNKFPEDSKRPLIGNKVGMDNLKYSRPWNSALYTQTARTIHATRSFNFNYCVLSEFAFYPDPDGFMTALMPGFVEESTWDVVMAWESTANLMNLFYEYCLMGMDPENDEYDFRFLSWKNERTCRVEVPKNFILDAREKEFKVKYELDMEQMAWARKQRKRKSKGIWEVFNQEYPVQWLLAFLFAGFPWFDLTVVDKMIRLVDMQEDGTPGIQPLWRGFLDIDPNKQRLSLVWTEDEFGPLMKWEDPIDGETYSLGGDFAFGVGRDYTDFAVIKNSSGSVVAHYRSNRVPTEKAGLVFYILGWYYNLAYAVGENNGPGWAALQVALGHTDITQIRGGYPNLYFDIKDDRETPTISEKIGFTTARKSRDRMLSDLRSDVNAGVITIHSRPMLMQLRGAAQDRESGKFIQNHKDEVSGLFNDDSIFSLGMANFGRRHGAGRPQWFPRAKSLWDKVAPDFMKVGL